MENETENQTLEETPQEETSEKTVEKETPKEQIDYKTKFIASQTEAIRLNKENEELKKQKVEEIPEEEKKIREIFEKTAKEKEEQKKTEDEKLQQDLSNLRTIFGDFNEEKLLKIVDRYGVYDGQGNVQWERAMELYQKLDEIPTAPKKIIPSSQRTGDVPRKEPYDVKGKNLWDIAEESKKELQE